MTDIFSDRYKFRMRVILEPLTDIERQVAIAFVKLGYEVEILPARDPSAKVVDFKVIRSTDET